MCPFALLSAPGTAGPPRTMLAQAMRAPTTAHATTPSCVYAGSRFLFVSGSKDADGENVRLLRAALSKMACVATCELHVVEGGKHNPFESTPKKLNQVLAVLIASCPGLFAYVHRPLNMAVCLCCGPFVRRRKRTSQSMPL